MHTPILPLTIVVLSSGPDVAPMTLLAPQPELTHVLAEALLVPPQNKPPLSMTLTVSNIPIVELLGVDVLLGRAHK